MTKQKMIVIALLTLVLTAITACTGGSDSGLLDGDTNTNTDGDVELEVDGDTTDSTDAEVDMETDTAIDCTNCDDFTGEYCYLKKINTDCIEALMAFSELDFEGSKYRVRKNSADDCDFIISVDKNTVAGYPSGDMGLIKGCDYTSVELYAAEGAIDPPLPIPASYDAATGMMFYGYETCLLVFSKAACDAVDGDVDMEQTELEAELDTSDAVEGDVLETDTVETDKVETDTVETDTTEADVLEAADTTTEAETVEADVVETEIEG